jgi:hypothetical protein
MPAPTKKRIVELSDEDLQQLMGLVQGSDSVELKLTVPEEHHRSTITALGLDPLAAQIRQVFFFDTPDLALNKQGVVVRARRVQGRGDDTVVKLRPVVPEELPGKFREAPGMVVEVDAMPGGWVCSASFKGSLGTTDVTRVASGDRSIRKLFSKEQRAFYEAHVADPIALDDLAVLGPIFVLKLNLRPEGYARKMVAEAWLYPDGSRILELSTKCAPADMLNVAVQSRLFLSEQGLDLSGEQQTKTRTALDFFSQQLQAPSVEPSKARAKTASKASKARAKTASKTRAKTASRASKASTKRATKASKASTKRASKASKAPSKATTNA